jgi:hypothetical protein
VGALRQMDDHVDANPAQGPAPIAAGGDVAEQHPLGGAGRRLGAAQASNGLVAALGQAAAQGTSDKPCRTGYQDPRHTSLCRFCERLRRQWIKQGLEAGQPARCRRGAILFEIVRSEPIVPRSAASISG